MTLTAVARRAGVDPSVVSRVLNDDPVLNIRAETRERVLDAVRALGYRPNMAARSLRTARTGTIGLFIPDFANPVYAEIIKGAEESAAAAGCVLVTGSSSAEGVSTQTYLDLLGQGRVDGLLLASGTETPDEQELIAALGLPWLLINRRGREATRYVVADDERAARIAVEHLLEQGHRRIGHVAGPPSADTAQRRQAGWRGALRQAGVVAAEDLVAAADYTPDGGAEAMERLLSLPSPPTGVFVANIASAIGALHTAHRLGLRVPADVSVVAVHDLPLAAHLVPPLTTVRMPLRRLGARAAHLLLSTDPDTVIQEVVSDPIELTVRASTSPPPPY